MAGWRWTRRAAGAVVVGLLAVDGITAFHLVGEVHAVSVASAVARFRREYRTPTALSAQSTLSAQSALSAAVVQAPAPSVTSPPVVAVGRPTARALALPRPVPAVQTTTPTAGLRPILPGVYSYATTGGEQVSTLGGISHSYPATSTITVTPIPCGYDTRWAPLDARYDDYQLCSRGDAVELQSLVSYHSFDGQVQKKTFSCDPGTDLRPPTSQPGARFGGHCAGSGSDIALSGRVVGPETMSVDGQAVPVLHCHLDEILTGDIQGSRSTDAWWAMADNMLVRFESNTDAPRAQSSFGPTHYTERYTIQLASMHPQQ